MALPTVTATRVEVRNLDTDEVYYTKGTGTVNPASVTKLLTAYIVRQHKVTTAELSEQVTIQASDLTGGGTGANISSGNILTIWQLLVNALLPSSNNSCLALARVIGQEFLDVESGGVGDPVARFTAEMATQAAALGMTSSSFSDPHGNNTTSATTPTDINTLLDVLRTDPVLLDIWRWGEYRITMISGGDLTLTSTNDLVGDSGVFGGKTGSVAPHWNLALLYEAPNGQTIALTTLGSTGGAARTTDMRAILAELLVDYPELATAGTPWTPARLFDHHAFDGGWWDGSDTSTLWQDTAATVAVTANNDPVARWNPKVGSSAHWRQATIGARPLWKSATDALSLDGTDDHLSIGGTTVAGTGLYNSGSNEWMLYVRLNTTDTQGTIIGRAGSTSGSRTYQLYIDGASNPGHNERGSNVNHAAGLNTAGLTAVGSFRDGTQSGTATRALGNLFKRQGTASEQTSEHILLGARTTAAPTSFLAGEVSQVVIVDQYDADAFFRLRAWMQGAAVNAFADPTGGAGGTSDTADGVTVSASASLIAGAATGQVNATAAWQTLTATASLVAGAASGQANATAAGATVSAAASLIPGAATGESGGTAAGATVAAETSLIPGAAQGEQNATAAGQTLTASASLIAGAASGGSTGTAAGATVQASAALLPGAATGEQNATAAGATITATASLQAGTATAGQDATAGGALLSVGVAIIAGAASAANDATAGGVLVEASAQFLAGAASGQAGATAAGVVISMQAALIAGGAFGPASSTTRGYTARLADRPRRAAITGGATRTAKRAA